MIAIAIFSLCALELFMFIYNRIVNKKYQGKQIKYMDYILIDAKKQFNKQIEDISKYVVREINELEKKIEELKNKEDEK